MNFTDQLFKVRSGLLLGFLVISVPGLLVGEFIYFLAFLYLGCLWLLFVRNLKQAVDQVRLRRRAPDGIYEGGRLETSYYLANEGDRPLFAPLARDRLPFSSDFESRARFPGLVNPGEVMVSTYRTTCRSKFGRFTLGPTSIKLSDPLGFAEVTRVFEIYQPLTLYPRWEPIAWLPIYGGRLRFSEHTKSTSKTARGLDFYGIRQYHRGDSMRHIHWRSVARHDELMVKQFEFPASSTVHMFLDLHRRRRRGLGSTTTLTATTRLAASVAAHVVDEGHRIGLYGQGNRNLHLPPRGGDRQLFAILESLIDIKQEGDMELSELLKSSLPDIGEEASVVLVVPTTRIDPWQYVRSLSILEGRRASILVLLIDDRGLVRLDGQADDYQRDWTLHELKNAFLSQGAWCRIVDPEKKIAGQFPGREQWVNSVG